MSRLGLSFVAQPSPGGKSVAKDKKVIKLDEDGSDGTGSDAEGSDDHGSEEGEDSGANVGSEDHSGDDDDWEDDSGDDNGGEDHSDDDNSGGGEDDNDNDADGSDGGDRGGRSPGADIVQPEVEEDEEDDDVSGLIPRRRTMTEGFLTIPDINQLAPEAIIQQQSPRVAEVAVSLFNRRVNVPPTDDLVTHFVQAHDAAVALTNLNFADIQIIIFLLLNSSDYFCGTSK